MAPFKNALRARAAREAASVVDLESEGIPIWERRRFQAELTRAPASFVKGLHDLFAFAVTEAVDAIVLGLFLAPGIA